MKKTICAIISIVLMLCLFAGCNMKATDKSVIVEQTLNFNPANAIQTNYNPNVALMTYDNKLYFYNDPYMSSEYAGKLCVFADGKTETVVDLGEAFILGSYGEYVYFFRYSPTSVPDDVLSYTYKHISCFSLRTMKEKYLTSVKMLKNNSIRWFEDGTVYIPTDYDRDKDAKEIEYSVIVGDKLNGTVKTNVTHQVGDKTYTLQGYQCEDLYRLDGDERVDMNDYLVSGDKALLPCNKGLLIHNYTNEEMLYFIDGKGQEIEVLFEIECMCSLSTVNVYGDTAFISFKRFEKWGGFPETMLEYKNDTLQGTYRIDLNSGAATKISDEIYETLYIFGEGVIYATDVDGQIFKLDFDGNCIDKLLAN